MNKAIENCQHDPTFRRWHEAGGGTGCPICNREDIERRESCAPLVPVTVTVIRSSPFGYFHEMADEIREILGAPYPQILQRGTDWDTLALSVMARITPRRLLRLRGSRAFSVVEVYRPTGDAALLLAARIAGDAAEVARLEAALDAQELADADNAAAEASGKRFP